MTPENGGRIELRLEQATADHAEYAAHLQTSHGSWRAPARVGPSAPHVVFGSWQSASSPEPPEWLAADARAALKAALRTSQTEGRWPRRLTRWRAEPGS